MNPNCFSDIADLGVDDIMRGRDHGMPSYNAMRVEYGLPPVRSFTAITGEPTDVLPAGMTINNPHIMDLVQLRDRAGNLIPLSSPDAQQVAVTGIRRSTLAARLKGIYGSVDKVDAFVGMVSERHIPGTEFGPLQLAMWQDQFTRLRDGDRFFYQINPALSIATRLFGVTYRHSLADIVTLDTGAAVPQDLFHAAAGTPAVAAVPAVTPAVEAQGQPQNQALPAVTTNAAPAPPEVATAPDPKPDPPGGAAQAGGATPPRQHVGIGRHRKCFSKHALEIRGRPLRDALFLLTVSRGSTVLTLQPAGPCGDG